MTEHGYVEEAMLEWLAGKDADPNDHGLPLTNFELPAAFRDPVFRAVAHAASAGG